MMKDSKIEFLINAVQAYDFDDEICSGLLEALRELEEVNKGDGPIGIGALGLIIRAAVAEEREACAKIADEWDGANAEIANAIRARRM